MTYRVPLICSLLLLLCLSNPLNAQIPVPDGGGEYVPVQGVCMTAADREAMKTAAFAQMELMREQGLLPDPSLNKSIVSFDWPVVSADERFPNVDGLSNYVDQNMGVGVLEYNCGTRTYDGHYGTDIYTWPFTFYQMDNDIAHVVAAAPGTIIFRADGNFDRQCSWTTGASWNAVYVAHADGSFAAYGHLKSGSLTTKGVGATVAAGEYLGVVGSSGISTGPHLHLEVYDFLGNLIDPYAGSCNSLNPTSWWSSQDPYWSSKLNLLSTHKDVPVFPTCPTTESPNFENQFYFGDVFRTAVYLRDQQPGQVLYWKVYQGDGSLWASWSQNLTTLYNSSWWYWNHSIGSGSVPGNWRLEVTYLGEVYTHDFKVCSSPTSCPCFAPIGLDVDVLSTTAGVFSWQGDINSQGFQMMGGKVGGPTGTKITFNDSQLIPVLDPGSTYNWQVRALCTDGTISPFSGVHTFSTPTVALEKTGFEVEVYPNPADEVISISRSVEGAILYSITGQLVASYGPVDQIETGDLVNDIYLLELQAEGEIVREKIVIEH